MENVGWLSWRKDGWKEKQLRLFRVDDEVGQAPILPYFPAFVLVCFGEKATPHFLPRAFRLHSKFYFEHFTFLLFCFVFIGLIVQHGYSKAKVS